MNIITDGDGSLINNIKVCVSLDKSHMTYLNIGWDGVRTT